MLILHPRTTSRLWSRAAALARPLRIRELRTLWLAQLTSELGDWASRIALAVLVFDRTHSALATGLVTTASLLPYALIGPLTAAIADRQPRRRVMVAADLLRAGIFLTLATPGVPTPVLLIGALVAGLATPPFEAARSAMRSELMVDDAAYGSYNALSVMTGQVAVALGYLFGGGLIVLLGTQGTLGLNGASFLVSALLVSRLKGSRPPVGLKAHLGRQLADGARALFGERSLRLCVVLGVTASVAGTVPEALGAAFEHSSPTRAAMLLAAAPVALILVSALIPVTGDDRSLLRVAGLVLVGGGAMAIGAFLLASSFGFALLAWASSGTVFGVIVAAGPVVRRRLPTQGRAVAFGMLQAATLSGCCVAGLAGGALADLVGVRYACIGGAALAVATGLGLLFALTTGSWAGAGAGPGLATSAGPGAGVGAPRAASPVPTAAAATAVAGPLAGPQISR